MKHMIQLTAIPHPDINGGKPYPIFVDVEPILLIERTSHQQQRSDLRLRHNIAVSEFWEEAQRCTQELSKTPRMDVDSEEGAQKVNAWVQRREISSAITAAFNQLNSMNKQADYYDPVECTVIQMGAQNSRYTMLPCVYVLETPEEVMQKVSPFYS